jgi:hypothetical protein
MSAACGSVCGKHRRHEFLRNRECARACPVVQHKQKAGESAAGRMDRATKHRLLRLRHRDLIGANTQGTNRISALEYARELV